jgi:hypothetical protein
MSYDSLLRIPCTLQQRDFSTGSEDAHGNPTAVVTPVESRCFLSSQRRTESGTPETQVETYTLFLLSSAPVDGWDAVTVLGETYELVGPPAPVFRGLTGHVHHVEATLRKSNPVRVAT